MTLKQLAHAAHQQLQTACGVAVARSHVHELLAAAFGHGSWAAFRADCVLSDAGVGDISPENGPALAGRALQLNIPQRACLIAASTLHAFLMERRIGAIRWEALQALTRVSVANTSSRQPYPSADDEGDDDDEDDLDFEDERPSALAPSPAAHLARSPLLLDELASRELGPKVHHHLAGAFRCQKPNPYL